MNDGGAAGLTASWSARPLKRSLSLASRIRKAGASVATMPSRPPGGP
jgi:hypothetical protein